MLRHWSRPIFTGVLFCVVQFVAVAGHAQLFSQTIPGSELATQLQTALSATQIHLHNLGPLKSDSYYQAHASSIKIPASVTGIPGQRTYFSLPDASTIVLDRRYGYYVDHVRSNGLFVTANADSFTISITLASSGPALVGTCVRLKHPQTPCTTLGETLLPGVQWRDARIDIIAKPVVRNRSIALDIDNVVIGGEFDAGSACEWPFVGARLCAAINRQSQRLRSRVADQVKANLNSVDVRDAVAAGVRQYLDANLNAAAFAVKRVAMKEGQLLIAVGLGGF